MQPLVKGAGTDGVLAVLAHFPGQESAMKTDEPDEGYAQALLDLGAASKDYSLRTTVASLQRTVSDAAQAHTKRAIKKRCLEDVPRDGPIKKIFRGLCTSFNL